MRCNLKTIKYLVRRMGFPGAQMVKYLPVMQATWIRPLGWENPLEEEMTAHSNIPAWRIPWIEEHGRIKSSP